ncbi:MAG: ArsR family transcriptional regulator [Chloroflexota bacterium]
MERLAAGEATVNELRAPFAISQPAISKHLKVLELADGCSAASRGLPTCPVWRPRRSTGGHWLERYRAIWEERFERLDEVLAELQQRGDEPQP